jgi:hypothetical protein
MIEHGTKTGVSAKMMLDAAALEGVDHSAEHKNDLSTIPEEM